ncbi:tRNA 2-thiouridine(34) synthase MnmA [Candidatus Kaiserbacteria bacterium CG10_big_fil_rev_8_21_14_0_10_43_70]|uniref:tRNA-specific 2-thiouridylase MnmA n=1 Tax=Candidatus Kaiserbacteria bacterium CG10_big_fil_rev_8_21_14_0_10_43_70 TaxID=1974605 RepID=A0A2H0UJ83_9BACT|nr:MAG: tRNA 2-thiouridine(34) synthase MnmA [Candidatus Kaiserbacteria bacterium CG10_big_fil_rev_8_21_14_0_10_43_70]
MEKGKKRVFVALSGGVDSAVAAFLLKKATPNNFEKLFGRPTPEGFRGYDVTGVFIKIWQPEFIECTWKEDRLDAMRVAVSLGIPFKEVDLSEEYKREVIDDMLSMYKKGFTPNPDVLCNRHIKFGALWKWAKERGADYIATGHHARVESILEKKSPLGNSVPKWGMLRGVDEDKDQSYFLWQLTQGDLSHILMPVGEMDKGKVRLLAKKHNLPVAQKPDSQGLCFVGHINMSDFLQKFIDTKPGRVVLQEGTEVGTHNGSELYTIGQRHGFAVFEKGEVGAPSYVSGVNVKENTITVSKNKNDILQETATLNSINWIRKEGTEGKISCQSRYRQSPQACTILEEEKEKVIVHFEKPQIAVPGQSLVFYEGAKCLGGGIIMQDS